MYFIGSTDHRGTYFFHSRQHRGWIVADLDTGKASLHNTLATILVNLEHGRAWAVRDRLEHRAGLGADEARWLIDGEDVIPLLRDFPEVLEVLMIYQQDGSERPHGIKERGIARAIRASRHIFEDWW